MKHECHHWIYEADLGSLFDKITHTFGQPEEGDDQSGSTALL